MRDMSATSVYVAGPDGFSEASRLFLDTRVLPWLRGLGLRVLNPWTMTTPQEMTAVISLPPGPEREKALDALNMSIGRRNYEDGIRACTFMIANLDGQEIDSGTAAEVAAAAVLGKRVFGRRSDFRLTGEEGAVVNVQVEYFIRMSGGTIARSFEDLQRLVEGYLAETSHDKTG